MKRLLLTLLLVLATGAASAQGSVDYRGQYAALYKEYLQNPDDIATLTALADHFADPANPQRDLALAGRYIHRAEGLFEQYLQDDKQYRTVTRLMRKGLDLFTLRARYRAVDSTAYAYLKAHGADMDEGELAAFADAFADNKTIATRVNQLWVAKAYARACQDNTIDAYYAFLVAHPGTPQADSAESRMEQPAARFYAQFDNEADILIAAQHYPASRTMQRHAMLQCSRLAYAEASRVNTIGAYSAYLERFPNGSNNVQALMHIDELNAAEFNALATPQDYADYALQHNDQPLADSAVARLRRMILVDHSTPAMRVYLKNFPLDPAYSDIYKEYYRWHAAEGNGAPLRRFAEENPNYPYRLTLESDMSRARIVDSIDLLKPPVEKNFDSMATGIYQLTGRRIAFVGLQRILQQQIARGDWAGAKARWQHFGICFEDVSTDEYNALGSLLADPKAPVPDIRIAPGRYASPCPSPDGRRLYLVIPRDGNRNLIYLQPSSRKGGRWEYGGDVTLQGLDGTLTHCALAADGRQAFLTIDGDIWTARVERDTLWVVGERLPYPVNTDAVETDAYPLADGSGLLLASDRDGGHNCQPSRAYFHGDTALATDLWFIPRSATGWGEPVNLGLHVNTPYCEHSPLLSRNGKTLYFVSDGPAGLGYGDIFRVTRANTDDWNRWSQPVNLGKNVNTPFEERSIAFAEGERRLYICSSTQQPGTSHLAAIPIHHDTTGNLQTLRLDLSHVGAAVQRVEVIDLTRQAIVQSLDTRQSGTIPALHLDKSHRYAILAQAPGLFVPAVGVEAPASRAVAPKGYTKAQVLEAAIPLGATAFSTNTHPFSLQAVADHELQQLALFLLDNPELHVQIEVHTPGSDAQQCYDISVEQAAAVRTRLAELGVDTGRIRLAGYGNVMHKAGKHPAHIAVRFLRNS